MLDQPVVHQVCGIRSAETGLREMFNRFMFWLSEMASMQPLMHNALVHQPLHVTCVSPSFLFAKISLPAKALSSLGVCLIKAIRKHFFI